MTNSAHPHGHGGSQANTASQLRRAVPALERLVWLDTPAVPPGVGPVLEALRLALDEWESGEFNWTGWEGLAEAARQLFAQLINATAETIALTSSLAEAASIVAQSVERGSVVVAEQEFRSNLFPWLALRERGIDVVEARQSGRTSRAETLLETIDANTELVAVSEVISATGERVDLRALRARCREVGARLFVNLTQTLGALRFDAEAVDADYVAAHGYKWLLAPRGAAWLHVRPDRLEELRPITPSWRSTPDPYSEYFGGPLELAPDAHRLDTSIPWLSWIGARAALDLITSLDSEQIETQALALAATFRDRAQASGLQCITLGGPSQIVALHVHDAKRTQLELERRRIVASLRGDLLRFGFHGFNNDADVEAALEALRATS